MATSGKESVTEGLATIYSSSPGQQQEVFYNPVQEFNRDISIAVINAYASDRQNNDTKNPLKENGLSILEALSATGLRSIRYAKEIPSVGHIVANDFSEKAVEAIDFNIKQNDVGDIVKSSYADAALLLAKHRRYEDRFDVVDLDPYGNQNLSFLEQLE